MFRGISKKIRRTNAPGEFIPIQKNQLPIRQPEGIYRPMPIDLPIDLTGIDQYQEFSRNRNDAYANWARQQSPGYNPSDFSRQNPEYNTPEQFKQYESPVPMGPSNSNIYKNPNGDINKNPNGDGAQSPKFQQLRQLMSKGPSK